MNNRSEITWKIGGEAGFGIMISGFNFARTMSRCGYYVFTANEYPSLIRGGHNTETVRVSGKKEIHSLLSTVDILIALNKETVDLHRGELSHDAAIIYDPNDFQIRQKELAADITLYPIPLLQISKERGGDVLMRNTVAIGASLAILDLGLSVFNDVLGDQFKRKGEQIVQKNIDLAYAGYETAKKLHGDKPIKLDKPTPYEKKVVITGNEALGLGAIASGMKFFAAYPMTPINGLLHFLALVQEEAGFIYKQPEDEIAAINMAIGASYAGVRSMTASSGGGFSLMVEGLSLAGMTESPLVIVYGMRPGPATGLPTWTGQGDLHFVLHAGHGEFPRIVLAPGDVDEAFSMAMESFNLAEIYQVPVFLLTDKFLNESRKSIHLGKIKKITDEFLIERGKLLSKEEQEKQTEIARYQFADDGISPRPIPGRKGGVFRANSDEHNQDGYSDEEAENAAKMVEKRMKKLNILKERVPSPKLYGPEEAETTLVGWGSTKGPALETLRLASQNSISFNYLHLNWIHPFPKKSVAKILGQAKTVVDIEGAHNSPMADWIKLHTGISLEKRIRKYDGRIFYPEEIIEMIKHYA